MDTFQLFPAEKVSTSYGASGDASSISITRYPDGTWERTEGSVIQGDFSSITPYDRRHEVSVSHFGSEKTIKTSTGALELLEEGGLGFHMGRVPLMYSNSCYNTAIERLYDSLRGNIDLSIDLAQYRATARTSGSLAQTIEKLGSDLLKVRGRYGKGKAAVKAAGSLWLQWQYGVKPTVSTLHDLLLKSTDIERQVVVVKGSAKESGSDSRQFNTDLDFNRTNKYDYKTRVYATYQLNSSTIGSLSELTSLNPISIGWELVPFSFCVDWLIDIGGFLRGTETALLHGGTFRSGYLQEHALVRSTSERTQVLVNGPYRIFASSRASYRNVIYKRSLLSGTPFPRLPPINLSMGWQRLTSAASLLTNLLPDSFEGAHRVKTRASK